MAPIAPIEAICDLADKYGALTFWTKFMPWVCTVSPFIVAERPAEAHLKAGIEQPATSTVMNRIDMVTGTLGKAYGTVGGYVTGKANMIDWFRSYAPGFIFTTSLPPAIMAGSSEAIRYQRSTLMDRIAQQKNTRYVKDNLNSLESLWKTLRTSCRC